LQLRLKVGWEDQDAVGVARLERRVHLVAIDRRDRHLIRRGALDLAHQLRPQRLIGWRDRQLEGALAAGEDEVEDRHDDQRDDEDQREGAPVVAKLANDASRQGADAS
jgi:hypothetical protein